MVGRRVILAVLSVLLLSGCAGTGTESGNDADTATSDEELSASVPAAQVPGPSWQAGNWWSFKDTDRGYATRTSYATIAVIASGIEHADAHWGLLARVQADDAAPAAPDPASATDWAAFVDGSPGVIPFYPEDYSCDGPRFCFDDPAFAQYLTNPTGEPEFPLVAGEEWDLSFEQDSMTMESRGTAEGIQQVEVEAGTFEAMHITMTQETRQGPFSLSMDFEADYAEEAGNWVKRVAFMPGEDEVAFEQELVAYSLETKPSVPLAELSKVVAPLNLTLTPAGPYNAADATVVAIQATGGSGGRYLELRDVAYGVEASSEEGALSWTANRTGRWRVAAMDEGYGFEMSDLMVGLDASVELACGAPDPVGTGTCATYTVPVGLGSGVLHAWLNATLAPLGGTLDLVRPDGVVAASVAVDEGVATLAADLDGPAGAWLLVWTPEIALPDMVTLHVHVAPPVAPSYAFMM